MVPYTLAEVRLRLNRLKDNYHILAGHYCVSPELEDLGSNGEAELASFGIGLDLVRALTEEGKTATLFLWVNDIGINPDVREKYKSDFMFPQTYQEILNLKGPEVSEQSVVVLFESTIRNRASGVVKKIRKSAPRLLKVRDSTDSDLVRCIGPQSCDATQSAVKKVYTIDSPSGDPIVVKEGPNPKCNMILATLFDVVQARYGKGQIINVFNSIYASRIELGRYVYEQAFSKYLDSIDIFCDMFGGAHLSETRSNETREEKENDLEIQ